MTDTSHLNALELRRFNERRRLNAAKDAAEIQMRTVWVAQIEKEIFNERVKLGLSGEIDADMSDDELRTFLMS